MINKFERGVAGEFLLWLLLIWVLAFVAQRLLLPYSIVYSQGGPITFGYCLFALVGLLFSTPAPAIATYITLKRREHITLKEFIRRIFATEHKVAAVIITCMMCMLAFVFARFWGIPSNTPWYMMPLGFIVMVPFVGITEETGWRGLLQPALEERMGFVLATVVTAVIWWVWHTDLWFDPTSNHYGDSFWGFAITILVWSFAAAALYRATKSVFACACYHAFIDSIGAVYNWNLLFDAFPGDGWLWGYRLVIVALSLGLVIYAKKRDDAKTKIAAHE